MLRISLMLGTRNWDVEELKAKAGEIEADKSLFTATVGGYPWGA